MEKKDQLLRFSRQWFLNIDDTWQKNLDRIPEFDIGKLKTYLTESRSKTFDKEGMRAYKSLKAYKYFEEGYVQKISSVNTDEYYLVRAEVMASMAQKIYKAYVCLSNQGDVQGGSCDCVAGKGEACSHIAALLFTLDDYVSKGLKDLPSDQTKTEKLCQWNQPAKRKIEPKTVHNIRIVKQEHGKVPKERETLDSLNFDPRHPDDRQINENSFQMLRNALKSANPTCGFLKYNQDNDNSVSCENEPQVKHTARHCTDLDLPPSLDEIRTACQHFKGTLNLEENELNCLEENTLEQTNSKAWHHARKFRLTASNFHKIGFRRKSDPSNLLNNMLYGKTKQTTAMLFGLEQEHSATERFVSEMSERGASNISVDKRGLVVHREFCYLGASVDGVVKIDGESHILELKNPHSTWNSGLLAAAKKLQCLKVDENNAVSLNRRHAYYTQVQGQMAILQIHKCYFVLCTSSDIHIELIEFDQVFWNSLLNKLQQFYDNVFLPEIVYPSVKYGLSPLDLTKF